MFKRIPVEAEAQVVLLFAVWVARSKRNAYNKNVFLVGGISMVERNVNS